MIRTARVVLTKQRWVVVFFEDSRIIDTSSYDEWLEAAAAIRLWLEKGW